MFISLMNSETEHLFTYLTSSANFPCLVLSIFLLDCHFLLICKRYYMFWINTNLSAMCVTNVCFSSLSLLISVFFFYRVLILMWSNFTHLFLYGFPPPQTWLKGSPFLQDHKHIFWYILSTMIFHIEIAKPPGIFVYAQCKVGSCFQYFPNK